MKINERFLGTKLPQDFFWFNEPLQYKVGNGLEIITEKETDFWQNTHYGFQRDDGHFLFVQRTGDFSLSTNVIFRPSNKYDQCGLMVRIDDQNWIKVSTEFESDQISRLGSVVTNLGYSDWATQDIKSDRDEMWYRISKRGSDFLLEYSFEGNKWHQMRIAHLHKSVESYAVGVYACSPIGKAFWCCFKVLEISQNFWQAAPETD